MKILLLALLISLISVQDDFETIISEQVSEEYCNNVIGNLTALIKEGYVYSDFLKAPKQPKPNYFNKMDLIQELEDINTTNRSFYDFYGDIVRIIGNTEDGHFAVYSLETPNKTKLTDYYFCIPFYYYVKEVFDDDNITIKDTYLTIDPLSNYCQSKYSNETLTKINELSRQKIISINGLDPFEYLEKIGRNVASPHSPQCKYIDSLDYTMQHSLIFYPHKKEDLPISIQFEGNELLETEYTLQKRVYFSEEFREYYLAQLNKSFKNNIPFPKFEEIEKKFKIKKGLINKLKDDKDMWDLQSEDETIKCRVDNENQFNVFYQSSFSPDNFNEYEDIMYKCFSKFYSNDFKIIVIEDRNGGGYSELCIPFTQYLRPKISKPSITALKSTQLNLKNFFRTDENLNPKTCFPYTEEDNILDGPEYIYNDGIDEAIHKRTKDIEGFNIFEKKILEKKRVEYLKTGKTKKPTDILVFTDGYSFSCTSVFIKGLQVYGHGIIVGFNTRPGLDKSDFDASQSNSAVETFDISENVQNLRKLGYNSHITFAEEFDPNDKETPKTPMEFLIYPVDEISTIYKAYNDNRYQRFMDEAKRIFTKYETECNPANKFLYKETEECDSKINIPKAHGGYICGEDGKWDTNQCIAAYCDDGFYLNDDRTECIRNPCDDIQLNEIIINEEKEKEYIIEPNNSYIFTIEKEKYLYYFYSELDPFIYVLNEDHILEAVKNGTVFKNKDKIYVNYFVNITENTTITIKSEKDKEEETSDKPQNNDDKKEGLSTGIIVLIVVGSAVVVIAIVLIVIIIISKKKKLSNEDIEEKTQQLNSIET